MVGAEGFEPPTLCSQSRCATRLRYAPTSTFDCIADQNPVPSAPGSGTVCESSPSGAEAPPTFCIFHVRTEVRTLQTGLLPKSAGERDGL